MNLDSESTPSDNPFALMVDPKRVLSTMAHSTQLRSLQRRRLHPLDKPLIPLTPEALAERDAFDAAIDADDGADRDYYLN